MNSIRFLVLGWAVTTCMGLAPWALGQPTGTPSGLAAERALPSRHEYVVQDMLKFCEPAKGFWVDLGAGQGQVAIPLTQETGNPVLMVDPNAEAMSIGLQNARENGLQDRLSAVIGVAEALPFPDNSVDLLVSRGSIFFWDNPAKGLQEVYRVLRPGCRAYIGGGAGSGYPPEATAALIQGRKKRLEGDEAERWQRFVELRRPKQMRQWAESAGLPEFQIMGHGAISADDPRVGQGVWLLFEKQPETSTQKDGDSVSVARQGDAVVYSIHSASGIGSATIRPGTGWPAKVLLRLYLRGLESLTVSHGPVELSASVASHSGHPVQWSVRRDDSQTPVEQDKAPGMKIGIFDADGQPVEGLPEAGGYFEVPLPAVLLDARPKSLTIHWIDFYRS
jgi:SAM-dependent methyltransferase